MRGAPEGDVAGATQAETLQQLLTLHGPMSPQLSHRCALALLAALIAASVVGLLALGPVSGGAQDHRLTDPRLVAGMLNGWSVLLQLPLLAAALAGVLASRQIPADTARRRAWIAFFALAALATLASIADHLAPSQRGYLLSKLPTASACAVVALIFLAERLGPAWQGRPAFALVLASGPLGGLLCWVSGWLHGQPDFRLLLWLEHLPLLLVPLAVWSLKSRGLQARDWVVALVWFALAELIDMADAPIWQASGGTISGHALHHLPLAACMGWLAWRLARQAGSARRALPEDGGDSVLASQPATSLNTAG